MSLVNLDGLRDTKQDRELRALYPDRIKTWTRARWKKWLIDAGVAITEELMDGLGETYGFADEPVRNDFGIISP